MIPPLASYCLSRSPVKRMIQQAGHNRTVDHLFQKLSGAGRIFQTIAEARESVRRHRPETLGHLDEKLIAANYSFYSNIQMSDYPVLLWLFTILRSEKIDLFDFGGGVGQTFVSFSRYLPEDGLVGWTVHDLPSVVSLADEIFSTKGFPQRLKFTSGMASASSCNVVLAAGSFHFWEKPIADFFKAMGTKPAHFIINRSPMQAHGRSFFTVQEGVDWAVPCQVRSLDEVEAEMQAEGYTLVESWIDPEKSLILPFFPDYSCPYRGLYFYRDPDDDENDLVQRTFRD